MEKEHGDDHRACWMKIGGHTWQEGMAIHGGHLDAGSLIG
jgi:hypothetical protein